MRAIPDEPVRFSSLLLVLDALAEASEDAVILVEGRRDMDSLAALGCRGTLVPLNQGEPLFRVCEAVAGLGSPTIVLTDWDRRGDILFTQVAASLQACGCRVDATYRERIRANVNGDLKDVESLAAYVARGLERFRRTTLEEHLEGLQRHRAPLGHAESF